MLQRPRASSPRVSVIMPCRNGLPFLAEALESLRAQTYPDWELLFVDGASVDGGVAAVAAEIPEARIVSAPDVPPAGAARNRAVSFAKGDLLAFLDSDDRWAPRMLERQVDLLTRSGADLVYSDCHVIDSSGQVLGRFLSRHEPTRGSVLTALTHGNFVPLPTIVVTRSLFERSGGFSDDLRIAADYDWLLRAARIGTFEYQREALADYRIRPGSLTHDFRSAYRENVEIFHGLVGRETDPDLGTCFREGESRVLWRWALREALGGPGSWKDTARLGRQAAAAAPGTLSALRVLAEALRGGVRGLGLRRRMLRARRGGP